MNITNNVIASINKVTRSVDGTEWSLTGQDHLDPSKKVLITVECDDDPSEIYGTHDMSHQWRFCHEVECGINPRHPLTQRGPQLVYIMPTHNPEKVMIVHDKSSRAIKVPTDLVKIR